MERLQGHIGELSEDLTFFCGLSLAASLLLVPTLSRAGYLHAPCSLGILCRLLMGRGPLGCRPPQHANLVMLCLQERFVVHITDVLAVAMMLGITAQVKEAGTAWDKGEKKSKDPGQTQLHPVPGQR